MAPSTNWPEPSHCPQPRGSVELCNSLSIPADSNSRRYLNVSSRPCGSGCPSSDSRRLKPRKLSSPSASATSAATAKTRLLSRERRAEHAQLLVPSKAVIFRPRRIPVASRASPTRELRSSPASSGTESNIITSEPSVDPQQTDPSPNLLHRFRASRPRQVISFWASSARHSSALELIKSRITLITAITYQLDASNMARRVRRPGQFHRGADGAGSGRGAMGPRVARAWL